MNRVSEEREKLIYLIDIKQRTARGFAARVCYNERGQTEQADVYTKKEFYFIGGII